MISSDFAGWLRENVGMCLRAAVGLTLVALLAGCTPTPTVLPEAVVEHQGTAGLDGDKFVVALRAAQVSQDMAWNSGDFTIDPLVASMTVDGIDSVYKRYFSYTFREYDPEVYVGPPIWAPISVEPTVDGAEVTVCLAEQDRTITKKNPDTSYDLATGRVLTWVLIADADGRVKIDHGLGTQDPCDVSDAEVLTFDPVPVLPEKISEGDTRAPQGE